MKSWIYGRLLGAAAVLSITAGVAQAAPFMIVGNDEKLLWDDNGKPVFSLPGKDSVLIVDLANPLDSKIVANLPLKNSVVGPPVNLAIDPTSAIALVADSVTVIKDGESLKLVPDDKIHVIDLKASPAKLVETISAGKQPSVLSFSPSGSLALVANRADKSISETLCPGNLVASARLPPNFPGTRSRCSTWQATRSPTPSSISPPGCGRTTSRWRRAARSH